MTTTSMSSGHSWSPDAARILARAGWHPARQVGPGIERLHGSGESAPVAAMELLKELGGLCIRFPEVEIDFGPPPHDIAVQQIASVGDYPWTYAEVASVLGTYVVIGGAPTGDQFALIDESGRLLLLGLHCPAGPPEDLVLYGDTVKEGVENLCAARTGPMLASWPWPERDKP